MTRAEAVFRHEVDKAGLSDRVSIVDSAGTSNYHLGHDPDPRTLQTCKKYRIPISHQAREILEEDFYDFDYILAMDDNNLTDINVLKRSATSQKLKARGSFGQLYTHLTCSLHVWRLFRGQEKENYRPIFRRR